MRKQKGKTNAPIIWWEIFMISIDYSPWLSNYGFARQRMFVSRRLIGPAELAPPFTSRWNYFTRALLILNTQRPCTHTWTSNCFRSVQSSMRTWRRRAIFCEMHVNALIYSVCVTIFHYHLNVGVLLFHAAHFARVSSAIPVITPSSTDR